MSDKTLEAEAFINYRLHGLSERNEHHEFEKIATRIARKRLSANILIANGPVSAGGDQQRDAESYTTRIPDELPHSAGFAAAASTSPIVVACTVQSTGLKAKVLADLAGICALDAAPVEVVAVYSAISIPEATVHDLQKTARETYSVTLDIYSGEKISTILAEPDLIWVAQAYLQLPASMVPEPDTSTVPAEYAQLLSDLRRNHGPAALTPATQGEIALGMRYATWDEHANSDLPEWIDFMGAFLAVEHDDELVFRACYEIAISRFRGMGIAEGSEDLIRRALEIAHASDRPHVFDDATVLLAYWGGMWSSGVATANAMEIDTARSRFVAHVSEMLQATDPAEFPIRAASLNSVLAFAKLQPNWVRAEELYGTPERRRFDPTVGRQFDETDLDGAFDDEDDVLDISGAMEHLSAVTDLLPRARGFSARSISDTFQLFAPALSSQPRYSDVRDAFDTAIGAVDGDAAIADRAHQRAFRLYESGKLLAALGEFHTAKALRLHGDLHADEVVTLRYIGQIYLELGLPYAAKMHFAHAAALAEGNSDDDVRAHAPRALFQASDAAHFAGCWADASAWGRQAVFVHNALANRPTDLAEHPELENHLQNEVRQLSATRQYWPDLEHLLTLTHAGSGVHRSITPLLSAPETVLPTEDSFQVLASEQYAGPVFADLGTERIADWEALGTRWSFSFENSRDTVLLAETFLAAFQVFLADIASHDPVITCSAIDASIRVDPGAKEAASIAIGPVTDNVISVSITMANEVADVNALAQGLVATAIELFSVVHARSHADLEQILGRMMRAGLPHKILAIRPYQDSADLPREDHYERCAAATRPSSSASFEPVSRDHLAASETLGTGYDEHEAAKAIRLTYEAAETWRYSLEVLLSRTTVQTTIENLRADGWRDWHILGVLMTMGLRWRMEVLGLDVETVDPQAHPDLATRRETESDPRMPDDVPLDNLELDLFGQVLRIAQRWGLGYRSPHADGGALRELMIRRYRFGTDDIPHVDILRGLDEDGRLQNLVETSIP